MIQGQEKGVSGEGSWSSLYSTWEGQTGEKEQYQGVDKEQQGKVGGQKEA